jgi:hypothetical protein
MAGSHLSGHANALEAIKEEQKEIDFMVKLPSPVDTNFCSHDNWGRSNHAEGIFIGVCTGMMMQISGMSINMSGFFMWSLLPRRGRQYQVSQLNLGSLSIMLEG